MEEGDVCKLGGYENRLLGYRTRLYNLCQTFNCTEDIDIIMFGKNGCGYWVELVTIMLQAMWCLRWPVAMS